MIERESLTMATADTDGRIEIDNHESPLKIYILFILATVGQGF